MLWHRIRGLNRTYYSVLVISCYRVLLALSAAFGNFTPTRGWLHL